LSDDDGDGATSEEEEYIRIRWDEEDMEEELEGPTTTKTRNTQKRPGGTNRTGRANYWGSTWGTMLRDGDLKTPGSDMQKMFIRRFRVPYSLFARLVGWAKGWHEKSETDVTGRPRCPNGAKSSRLFTHGWSWGVL